MYTKERKTRRYSRNPKYCKGSSLPLVICVGAFLLAFALALLYLSGLLLARTTKKVEQERCYQLASTFAKEMDGELKTSGSGFQMFANNFLNSSFYNEYNPDNPSTVYHYIAEDTADEAYGTIKMRLYKELNDEEKDTLEGDLPLITGGNSTNFTDVVEERRNQTFQRHVFHVEIIAVQEKLQYSYATEYFRKDRYEVEFSHDGKIIVWDSADNCWKLGNEAGADYIGWQSSEEPIHYRYHTEHLLSWEYKNVYEEADDGT